MVRLTRVLIAANSAVVRARLESRLAAATTLEVLGSLSLSAVPAQLEKLQPDVLLLDLDAREDESMSLALNPGIGPLVVLTDDTDNAWAIEVLRSGTRAILPRDATFAEIVAAIEASAAGLVVLHPHALPALFPHREQPELDPAEQILTPREVEVLRMMAEGLGNKEIASRLLISDHTVKFHISSIFAKLGVSSRTEAVMAGIRQGLIMI